MANVYFKILNKKSKTQYVEDILTSIRTELHNSTKNTVDDLYESTTNILNPNSISLNKHTLQFYIEQQASKNINTSEKEEDIKYIETANKKYFKDSTENKYYKRINNNWILAKNICQVNEDGSYIVKEKKIGTIYSYKKLYDVNDVIISMQVVNHENKPICSRLHSAELIGMKCEYVKKFKYAGVSGNSNDIVAAILNQFSSMKQTGYYMDKDYNLFKWDVKTHSFINNRDEYFRSPFLVDYEFDNTNKVIRKEYTGI